MSNVNEIFGIHKKYGVNISKPKERVRPTNGKLVWQKNGKEEILEFDKPFALLNYLKEDYIKKGFKKEELKIKYL